jgi:site-specific recombinase XerD
MTPLRERFIEDLRLRNRAPNTIECYVRHVRQFAEHFRRSPEQVGIEEIRQYQLHLLERKVSWSCFNQSGMMHLSVNLLRGKDLADSDRRLAGDWAIFSRR